MSMLTQHRINLNVLLGTDPLGTQSEVDSLPGVRAPRDKSGPGKTKQVPERRIRTSRDGTGPCVSNQGPNDESGPLRTNQVLRDGSGPTRVQQDKSGPAGRTRVPSMGVTLYLFGSAGAPLILS